MAELGKNGDKWLRTFRDMSLGSAPAVRPRRAGCHAPRRQPKSARIRRTHGVFGGGSIKVRLSWIARPLSTSGQERLAPYPGYLSDFRLDQPTQARQNRPLGGILRSLLVPAQSLPQWSLLIAPAYSTTS